MRASARHCTERSSGGTTRPWSATPTRRRTRRRGGRRRRTRSSRTRTCTGPTRRRRGGRPGRSRPGTSTSAPRPEPVRRGGRLGPYIASAPAAIVVAYERASVRRHCGGALLLPETGRREGEEEEAEAARRGSVG